MIKSKEDLKLYLDADRYSFGFPKNKIPLLKSNEWNYIVRLRHAEYHANNGKNIVKTLISKYYLFRLHRISQKIGVSIPINATGPGLCIVHGSSIFINHTAKIGNNCRIFNCVNIASNAQVGNDVYIAPGVKILNDSSVGNNVIIGANSVVHGHIEGDGITIAGVPARIIDYSPREGRIIRGFDIALKRKNEGDDSSIDEDHSE